MMVGLPILEAIFFSSRVVMRCLLTLQLFFPVLCGGELLAPPVE
jgi:hypothetical protein